MVAKTVLDMLSEDYFAEFATNDTLRLPRTPDDTAWMAYTLTGAQVGALQVVLYIAREQQRKIAEIEELQSEVDSFREVQQIIDCSVAYLDSER